MQVPNGHVWLQGDNQYVSRDSREYGPVPAALVKGKVFFKVSCPLTTP
jgi:inner membrane protease subunit 1